MKINLAYYGFLKKLVVKYLRVRDMICQNDASKKNCSLHATYKKLMKLIDINDF